MLILVFKHGRTEYIHLSQFTGHTGVEFNFTGTKREQNVNNLTINSLTFYLDVPRQSGKATSCTSPEPRWTERLRIVRHVTDLRPHRHSRRHAAVGSSRLCRRTVARGRRQNPFDVGRRRRRAVKIVHVCRILDKPGGLLLWQLTIAQPRVNRVG